MCEEIKIKNREMDPQEVKSLSSSVWEICSKEEFRINSYWPGCRTFFLYFCTYLFGEKKIKKKKEEKKKSLNPGYCL